MITKKLSLLTLLLLATFLGNAQQDPKAKAILDALSAKTKSYSTIKAKFTWEIHKKDQTSTKQEGSIVTKGSKYKLDIPGHSIFSDGETVWDYIKEANEVQVTEVEEDEDAINPSTIFTIYEKGFKYKFAGEDGATQVVNLYPENPDKKRYHTVKLFIDKNKNQISSLEMLMKDGTKQTYTIQSFLGNSDIPDSFFVFDAKKHPGVMVEDLR